MSQTLLFLCPHNAAKSVIAAAYCQRLIAQHGLDIHVTSAGTEPDAAVLPGVAARLQCEGFDVAGYTPRHVMSQDFQTASRIISLGCDVTALAPPGTPVEHWNDVPPPSQHLERARECIYRHVEHLVHTLKSVKA